MGIRADRVPDDICEVVDGSWFVFGQLAVDQLSGTVHFEARPPQRIEGMKDIFAPSPGDLVAGFEVPRYRFIKRRSVADIDQKFSAIEDDDEDRVNIGLGHIGAAETNLVAQMSQQLSEMPVVGVARAAEAMVFDAVEVVLETDHRTQSLPLEAPQLGDIFKWYALNLTPHQPPETFA